METILLADLGGYVGPVPPAAAQRLKQSGCVGVTVGKGLYEIDHRLLIGLFDSKQRQIVDLAQFQLRTGDGKTLSGSTLGSNRRFQGVGVGFNSM